MAVAPDSAGAGAALVADKKREALGRFVRTLGRGDG